MIVMQHPCMRKKDNQLMLFLLQSVETIPWLNGNSIVSLMGGPPLESQTHDKLIQNP